MSIIYQLRWLKPEEYEGAAQTLALHCQNRITDYAEQTDFDEIQFQTGIKLALSTLIKQKENKR